MNKHEKITCGCGAVYELTFDAPRLRSKDEARCRFCRLVVTSWPQPVGLRVVEWPSPDWLDRRYR